MDALTAIIKEDPQPLKGLDPSVPPELERVILKCLEKDPDNRYQHADEVVVNLRKLASAPEGDPAPSRPASPQRRIIAVAGIALIVVLGAALTLVVLRQETAETATTATPATRPAVAVLPFRNLSPDPENEYFADGMTEEIISKLSRIADLEVPSVTAVTSYKGTDKNLQQIGEELGVGYVLEGSVRKAGDRARIIAQIVDARTGFEVWSEEFDVELKDIFGVQERTALQIAEALDLQLSPQEQRAIEHGYTDNPEAYDAFLRGSALAEFFSSSEKLEAARDNFDRALELDPDYPLALVGLARVETQIDRNIAPDPNRLQRAEELIDRALEQEPDLAEAHFVRGMLLGSRYDYEQAVESHRRALRLDPDHARAWDNLSWALAYLQPPRAVEAEEAARRSIELQPSLMGAYYHLGRALLLQGRFDEAIGAHEQALQLDHTFETAKFGVGQVYLEQGKPEEALAEFAKLDEAQGSAVVQVTVAAAHSASGDPGRALRHLETALEGGYRDFAALENSRHLQLLRSDPRYAELLDRYRE